MDVFVSQLFLNRPSVVTKRGYIIDTNMTQLMIINEFKNSH